MNDKARILFVDDEKRVLNSMRGLFRREFELFLTTDGINAVKIAAENSIDVVVADQRMPGMTGIEVLGKVKELSPKTVRILLTGYADPEAVEGSINIGEVFRFLSKPCPPQTLRDTLKLAVAASRSSIPTKIENQPVDEEAGASRPETVARPVPPEAVLPEQREVRAPQEATALNSPAPTPLIPVKPTASSEAPDAPVKRQPVPPVAKPSVPSADPGSSSSHWQAR